MAWYCDTCKRYVEGNEVRVGRWSDGVRLYHDACLAPVRAETDDPAADEARAEAHAQEGQQQ